ncbi:hypothetical protein CASFOL_033765 [Castilleja foliolosa]|uniref:Secreted protein n=1 Tax=Castilleja foliolosa TaxID=1961234 RepID=A0ABD3BYP8_9LAMI
MVALPVARSVVVVRSGGVGSGEEFHGEWWLSVVRLRRLRRAEVFVACELEDESDGEARGFGENCRSLREPPCRTEPSESAGVAEIAKPHELSPPLTAPNHHPERLTVAATITRPNRRSLHR